MYETFLSCPVIDFSNVTTYFEQHYVDMRAYASVARSFNQAPPFPSFWLESKARSLHPELTRYGIFVRSLEYSQVEDELKDVPFDQPPKWLLVGDIFTEASTRAYGPIFRLTLPIAETGETALSNGNPIIWATDLTTGQPAAGDAADIVLDMSAPMSLALTFMHCKGVTLVDNIPPAGLQKKHQRKNSGSAMPLVTYKTILIQPATRVLSVEGNIDSLGMEKALHICRGHFKHFSETRPLFGKLAGTFWWPSHIRGSEDAGTAVRDYSVRPPSDER
jgi:hypothetical protein